MPKTIDLARAARSQDTKAFTAAITADGKSGFGAEDFTATGDGKAMAPTLSGADFTATGSRKGDR